MKHTFVLLLFVSVSFLAGAQRFGKTLKNTPGIVSYTYRNSFKIDVALTLDTIKTLGITDIEFSNLFGKTAAELRALLDARGMHCSSFGVSFDDLKNKTREVGTNAKTLGASFVRVAWVPHENRTVDAAFIKETADAFNAAGKVLKDEFNLSFCYHNHGYEFVAYENGTLFDYLVANTDAAYVNFELDILWAFHPGQDPAKLIKKYPKRFKLMHVKDLRKGVKGDFTGGTSPENDVALGTGQINIAEVIKAAQQSAIEHFYIEDESSAVKTQVPASLKYLKSL
ncbi:sugar phosphate isomerase/epimerase family protein [Chryseolinea lacunae]|uniref:Sugar phosphate isomerase/epimerase n=1 Tax=Chryseolinea lacunae TaxID=2801331 RepID=A0ABS1KQ90_9BACT|nr:sugar phosphate isomerase/epimerase [Chryseolinea lacunae]MBL0740451.1 sugar phosphate isomerase/epimerase [Chryseolinea lacunae]